MHRNSWTLAAILASVAVAACRPDFELKKFTTNEALYTASMRQFQQHHWDNAITGFEKLTTDLPPRDTLLPPSYWYLASAHRQQKEYLLAAQSYGRLVETFPDDSLAAPAALEAARSYWKLWRKPELDATYGQTALAEYNTLIGLYPTAPVIPTAQKELAELEDWFAQKDYDAGNYYFRRRAYDSANLYFKDVLEKFPNTPTARRAAIRLTESFEAIHYFDDARDLCGQLVQRYPGDGEVKTVCANVPHAPPTAVPDSANAAGKPPRAL
jgi:outer membrane protein assembly factor BamD